jgi:two-component system chemotaxis response regulator CheB
MVASHFTPGGSTDQADSQAFSVGHPGLVAEDLRVRSEVPCGRAAGCRIRVLVAAVPFAFSKGVARSTEAAGGTNVVGGAMAPEPVNHDIVVIGASAGGVEALRRLMRDLPADVSAAIFIVLHIGRFESHLAELLDQAGPLPVTEAESGGAIERGHVYVAASDRHLLLHDRHMMLRRGPRENMTRPAIDPLFRSAACNFGARVIGVVLSGALDDGTAGLRAIKRCGSIAVIQDPADAAVPDMPRSAQRHVEIDHAAPISGMGALLASLAGRPAGTTPKIPTEICLEAAIAAQELQEMTREDQLGTPSPFSCPECGGGLWELADGSMLRYHCHLGHAYTADAMLAAEAEEIERPVSRLLRSSKDRAELTLRLADRERARQNNRLADQLQARAKEYQESADLLQRLLPGRD